MPFVQSVDACLGDRIGADGLSLSDYRSGLGQVESGLEWLRQQHASNALPLLRLPKRTDDILEIRAAVARILPGAKDVVFLGTGGSGLGGQTLAQVGGWGLPGSVLTLQGPRVHFLDNLDPLSMEAVLAALDISTARFVVTSKSGGTGETTMQALAVLDLMIARGLKNEIGQRMLGITEPAVPGRINGLRQLLEHFSVPILDHDPNIGGRYSALTAVGLVPALMMGVDIDALRAGAQQVLSPVLAGADARDIPAAIGAVVGVGLAETKGKTQTVLMGYADRLERFSAWYVQLWGESLGKNGRGTTPIKALGPVDQHSQLQLFLAGPRDKLFTVITVEGRGRGPRMNAELAALANQSDFSGKTIGDLVAAQGRATADTFANNGLPVRTIAAAKLDARAIGALMMHFFLETMLAGHLMGVDPFDQPAVEEGKILAKRYLSGG